MSAVDVRSMTQTDLMSWRMEEDPILRSTIVSIVLLDKVPDQDRLVDVMYRAIDAVPMFKCRAVASSFPWTPPRWVDDRDFDLSWHLRRMTLPEPGTWKEVLEFARIAGMAAFDKDRPLWEFTVLDGLADGAAALVVKVHHSLTDGVGGMQLTREITDKTREGMSRDGTSSLSAPTAVTPIDHLTGANAVAHSVGTAAGSAVRAGARTLRHPVDTVRGAARILGSTSRMVRPATTTLSPVMTERSARRSFGVLELPVAALAAAATATQCSINDAFLAAVLLGMAEYHRRCGAVPPELMVTLPISLRTDRDPLGGNRISLARFALPLDISDPDPLMHRVHTTVESWRNEPAIPLSPHLAAMLNLLPVAVTGNMLKHMDFVASDVVGSTTPLYLAGAEITRQWAFSPTLGSAFNVTLMSYTTHVCVGINADAGAVPDLPALIAAVSDGFRAVLAVGPPGIDVAVTVAC
ncbi:diacylglycerol O-acyltransferase [Rhodococcus sp. SRB_17]|uniref:wax ester/triacylglycerol synthase domain-containing protein n=1 Tax=Rhodococcus sp. OK302 TaxID=1882769 RepID=UPI000B9412D3|nr:wax ester/triacylglycerol synthase domain-containing protein [Rhodococcus sp. OK302]NMM89600.1 diacylglycerol O-acyltransferase [Rhodococcus sp. SRB_17]OYD71026.1 diacylglycerol O-acyltransferase [Rhodococcus sp. OK302]